MRGRAAWMVASVFVLASCSTSTVTGAPVETVLTKADLYDPCTLPAGSLLSVGLDPSRKEADFVGVPDPEWHLCVWKASSFFITVLSTTHTFQEVKENPRNQELRTLTVAGRNAVTYYDAGDRARQECDVAFATDAGVVIVRSRVDLSEPYKQDPCALARTSAEGLNNDFPR